MEEYQKESTNIYIPEGIMLTKNRISSFPSCLFLSFLQQEKACHWPGIVISTYFK